MIHMDMISISKVFISVIFDYLVSVIYEILTRSKPILKNVVDN
jgi:hypothetical protein